MKKFRVWFTYLIPCEGYGEDFLEVEAANADQAYENVMYANSDLHGFSVESVEEM